jgi:flavorubredoxin
MAKKVSTKKRQSIIEVHKRYPDLAIKIIAAQHGVGCETTGKIIREYKERQNRKVKPVNDQT